MNHSEMLPSPARSLRVLPMIAGILGFLAVACGAFGAHALKERITPADLEIWKTGAQYHLVHAVLLIWLSHRLTALAPGIRPGALLPAAWALVLGILIFSGSLYALVLSQVRWLGAITPLGGLCLMAGWLLLALASRKS